MPAVAGSRLMKAVRSARLIKHSAYSFLSFSMVRLQKGPCGQQSLHSVDKMKNPFFWAMIPLRCVSFYDISDRYIRHDEL
jgi:hypothetical protein